MYEQFFQLTRKPFELTPNPAFLYLSRTHRKALTYVDYGLKERTGFILLTGEVGSGKTTLLRNLIDTLDAQVTLAHLSNTQVNPEQLIAMVNEEYGIDSEGRDKVLLLRDLQAFLADEYAQGHHAVLIIDEAQNLSPAVLEEVRMLSNLETRDASLLQIVLAGQPELGRVLADPRLRQLRQRISISCHLSPLTRAETEEYLFHRLAVAGNRDALAFSRGALDALHAATGGIPRLINIVGNFILLAAFTESTRSVNEEMVADITEDLGIKTPAQDPATERRKALLSALGVPAASGNRMPRKDRQAACIGRASGEDGAERSAREGGH
jgi:putative secretion ATPase (PEP-CTERM system associated)